MPPNRVYYEIGIQMEILTMLMEKPNFSHYENNTLAKNVLTFVGIFSYVTKVFNQSKAKSDRSSVVSWSRDVWTHLSRSTCNWRSISFQFDQYLLCTNIVSVEDLVRATGQSKMLKELFCKKNLVKIYKF